MGTFAVRATLANPARPQRRLTLDLVVDTGATYTLLPAEIVEQLELTTPRDRTVMLASGERVAYGVGQVTIELNGEEWPTMFLAGPSRCPALLGAMTLEGFGLAPDPVNKRLVPVTGLLARSL